MAFNCFALSLLPKNWLKPDLGGGAGWEGAGGVQEQKETLGGSLPLASAEREARNRGSLADGGEAARTTGFPASGHSLRSPPTQEGVNADEI